MTDSPELSVSPPAGDCFVADASDDPVTGPGDSASVRPRRRRMNAVDGLLPVPAVRMQQSLLVKNVVAPHLQQIQQMAETATAIHRARIAEITVPVAAWVNSAAITASVATLTAPGGVFDTAAELARIHRQSMAAQAAKMVELSGALSAAKMANSIVGVPAARLAADMANAAMVDTSLATDALRAATGNLDLFARVRPTLVPVPPVSIAFAAQLAEMSMWKPQVEHLLKSVASLSAWATDARTGWAELGRQAAAAARMFRDRLFLAVLAAQDAAMRGDLDRVAAFFDEFIELPRSNRNARLHAGVDVLIFLDLTQFGPEAAFELVELIEKEANRHYRRGRRLLADTELNHVPVVSLEALPAIVGQEKAAGMLPKAPSAETLALTALNTFDDMRLAIVVGDLRPAEAQVVIARGRTRSWSEAAIVCGFSPADAKRVSERVRGKVMRLVRLMQSQDPRPVPPLGR